jgi:hypothetical protein
MHGAEEAITNTFHNLVINIMAGLSEVHLLLALEYFTDYEIK